MDFCIPERPTAPLNIENVPIASRIKMIQQFINKLEYNHTNQNYFNLSKARPYSRVMDTAKKILRDCLPIKCSDCQPDVKLSSVWLFACSLYSQLRLTDK